MALIKQQTHIGDHTLGEQGSKISIMQYGDFQCGSSRAAAPVVSGILNDFGNKISYTFRHFPQLKKHLYAFDAACAAEAAGRQGKYWEMHNAIMDQASLSDEVFMGLAAKLGLDECRFVTDSISKSVHSKIDLDARAGRDSRVSDTPAFFVNGKRFDGCAADMYVLISIMLED